jgi:hypothetical protein
LLKDDGINKVLADFEDGWKEGQQHPIELGVGWPKRTDRFLPCKHHPDNVQAFLDYKRCQAAWNEFTQRVEINGEEFAEKKLIELWASSKVRKPG